MLNIEESFNIRLEKALAIRQMKPIDLVRKTKISESAISQYRQGKTEPKRDRLVLIANALSVDPCWLIGLDVPMEKSQSISTEKNNPQIIEKYNKLNHKGKKEADDYIDYLLTKEQYIKTSSEMVSGE